MKSDYPQIEILIKIYLAFPATSVAARHGDLFLRCVVSMTNSTHFIFLRLRLNFNNNDLKCLKMLKRVDFKCFVLRCCFQRKQIVDFHNLYSKIFNSHFEFLIFIEKYDCVVCVVCVVQRQRSKFSE